MYYIRSLECESASGVYLTFTTGGKIRKIAGYTDLQSVYIQVLAGIEICDNFPSNVSTQYVTFEFVFLILKDVSFTVGLRPKNKVV